MIKLIRNIFRKIKNPDICYNKKHYGADIISFDPIESRCTTCGKKVLIGKYKQIIIKTNMLNKKGYRIKLYPFFYI